MIVRKISSLLTLAAVVGLAGACDKGGDKSADDKKTASAKKDDKGEKKDEAGKEEAGKEEAGGSAKLSLEKLGLTAEGPGGSKVGDALVGSGVMVQGPNLVVTVEEASDSRPKTADAAKEDADMYSPQNLQTEDLDDGFVVTFENEGGMGKNYFVNVRREIGGKTYWCETTASNPEQSANAVAFCKSLSA
jgi:hypothetical protein